MNEMIDKPLNKSVDHRYINRSRKNRHSTKEEQTAAGPNEAVRVNRNVNVNK